MLIHRQPFWEKSGEKHIITITFEGRRMYEVRVDEEFYATAEHRLQAFDEVADIARANNWNPLSHGF